MNRASNGCGSRSFSWWVVLILSRSARITSMLPANSHNIWRHAPHGDVGCDGVGDDDDARERPVAFGHRLENRDALGAHRQAVGGVLDVAAGDDSAVGRFQRGADLELRERRQRAIARDPRSLDDVRMRSAGVGAAEGRQAERLARSARTDAAVGSTRLSPPLNAAVCLRRWAIVRRSDTLRRSCQGPAAASPTSTAHATSTSGVDRRCFARSRLQRRRCRYHPQPSLRRRRCARSGCRNTGAGASRPAAADSCRSLSSEPAPGAAR